MNEEFERAIVEACDELNRRVPSYGMAPADCFVLECVSAVKGVLGDVIKCGRYTLEVRVGKYLVGDEGGSSDVIIRFV